MPLLITHLIINSLVIRWNTHFLILKKELASDIKSKLLELTKFYTHLFSLGLTSPENYNSLIISCNLSMRQHHKTSIALCTQKRIRTPRISGESALPLPLCVPQTGWITTAALLYFKVWNAVIFFIFINLFSLDYLVNFPICSEYMNFDIQFYLIYNLYMRYIIYINYYPLFP